MDGTDIFRLSGTCAAFTADRFELVYFLGRGFDL